MIGFKNNSKRLEKEWQDLEHINPALYHIICFYNTFIYNIFEGKDTVITNIYRTKEEQEKICKKAKVKFYKSVHCLWRGVDLRINLEEWQIKIMELLINNKFPYDKTRPNIKTFVRHNIGVGDHIHIQNYTT